MPVKPRDSDGFGALIAKSSASLSDALSAVYLFRLDCHDSDKEFVAMAAPKGSVVIQTMLKRLAEDASQEVRKSSTEQRAGTVGTVTSLVKQAAS
jgi:hypothetical protein